jgi:hypothetical protein
LFDTADLESEVMIARDGWPLQDINAVSCLSLGRGLPGRVAERAGTWQTRMFSNESTSCGQRGVARISSPLRRVKYSGHIVVALFATMAVSCSSLPLSQFVSKIKSNSSKWLRATYPELAGFHW